MNEITLATDRNRPIRESASKCRSSNREDAFNENNAWYYLFFIYIFIYIYIHKLLVLYLNPGGPVSLQANALNSISLNSGL